MSNYYETLPRKRMSAGGMFLDSTGRILLVKPSYKDKWLLPGGVIERLESPYEAVIREVSEEIGITRKPDRLIVVSYVEGKTEFDELISFIFDFGRLTDQDISNIEIDGKEIVEYGFFSLEQIEGKLFGNTKKCVELLLGVDGFSSTHYIERGSEI